MNKNLVKVYESDASRLVGKALEVVHPRSVVEVRGIVANSKRVCIRGGGTGMKIKDFQIASLSDRFAVRSASPVRSLRCQTDLAIGGFYE